MKLNFPNINENFLDNVVQIDTYGITLEEAQKLVDDIIFLREALNNIHNSTHIKNYDYVHQVIDHEYHALFGGG
jgi:hypothetical protein